MDLNSSFILELVYVFGAATFVSTLFHRFNFPTLIGFILSGVLIGPGGLNLVKSVGEEASVFSELGTILLLFTIGLEISFSSLRKFFGSFVIIGFFQVVFTLALVALVVHFLFSVKVGTAIFIGFVISLSSTALVLKFLQKSNETQSHHGNSLIGILLFQDIAVIPMMLLLPLLGESLALGSVVNLEGIFKFGLKLVAGLGFIWLGSKIIFPLILERVTKTASSEIFYFSILFAICSVGYVAEHHGFSLSLGAFLAGVMISESSWGRQAMSEVVTMRDNFLGIFFIIIGMMVNPKILIEQPFLILSSTLLLILLKFLVIYGVGRIMNLPHKVAFICGLVLAHVGEFSFLLIEEGRKRKLLDVEEHQVLLAISVISLLLAPVLYHYSSKLVKHSIFKRITFQYGLFPYFNPEVKTIPTISEFHSSASNPGQTVIIGYGIAGENLGSALYDLEIPFTVIDTNHSVTKKNIPGASQVIFGDASSSEILYSAGISQAKLIVITVSSPTMTQAILNAIQKIRKDVSCVVRTQYLREAAQLEFGFSVDLVVAEFETSLEILARALKVYGIPTDKIHNFMMNTRSRFHSNNFEINDSLRRIIEMPAWEAFSSMTPILVGENSVFLDKTLAEINLRNVTGASIVAYYRESDGTQIPGADYKLQAGDMLHVIGSKQAIAQASSFIQFGTLS